MRLFALAALLFFVSSCGHARPERSATKKTVPVKKNASKPKAPPKKITYKSETLPHLRSIVIDPGHGGKDPGTKAVISPFTKEKALTLKTALKVQEFLRGWGYHVHLTRKTDVFIPLLDRVAFAKKHNCRLFVSIHYNSAKNPLASGVEVYYCRKEKDQRVARKSHVLGRHILSRLGPVTKTPLTGRNRLCVGNFCVIRETTMPAVLVEAGFLSNREEARKLKSPSYIRFIAWAIAKGIDDFVKKDMHK